MEQRKGFRILSGIRSLRTKITCIGCTFVLLALLLGDIWIYAMNYRNLHNEGRQRAYRNMQNLIVELERSGALQSSSKDVWRYVFSVYMKENVGARLSSQQDYNLCFQVKEWNGQAIQVEEIYNHTVFSYEDLRKLHYKTFEYMDGWMYNVLISHASLAWGGRKYQVVCGVWNSDMWIFHIEDITDIRGSLIKTIRVLLLVTLVLTMLVGFFLTVILRRMFVPLRELNETTKRMTENMYDQRVEVVCGDEIGELAESFNAMADAVEARTRSLEESEHRKTLMMGNLTHELKTPMTAISGYAETLLTTKLGEEDRQEALHYIYEECGRLERLSKKTMKLLNLETLNCLEAECGAKDGTEVDGFMLQDVVAETLFWETKRVCGKVIEDKCITLELESHGEQFVVDVDLMTEALINLVDNAVKASPKGGKIILRAQGDTISVQDFGYGIPEDEVERILEPFYMVNKSRSRKSGGAGLGLSIVSMIVKLHGGELSIQSEAGKGTMVRLRLCRDLNSGKAQ